MAFIFDTGKHGSINDNAMRDLPVGKHNSEIIEIKVVPVKADKLKKRKQISIALKAEDGKNYTTFLETQPKPVKAAEKEGEEMRARIAGETFNALLLAAGITKGVKVTLPMLKKLKGKIVGIETSATTVGKGETAKVYVNIRLIDSPFELADTGSDEEEEEYEDEEEGEEEYEAEAEEDEEEYEDDEEEEEEEPEPPKPKKKRAAKKAAKKRAKKVVEPEEDEEEEEGDSDEPW